MQSIRSALQRATKKNKVVRQQKVPVESRHGMLFVNLEITPITVNSTAKKFFLIVFREELPAAPHLANTKIARLKRRDVAAIVRENKLLTQQSARLKEQLQSATQNHEISSEEFQAAAEELQTSNEELETAKRELQSGNEELRVLNERLHQRNSELLAANQELASVLTNIITH